MLAQLYISGVLLYPDDSILYFDCG